MNTVARWSPLAGLVFVVLWIIAFAVTSGSPDSGDADTKIIDYYANSGHRTRDIVGLFLVLAASLFFIWFLAALRSRLAAAEGGVGALTSSAFGAGIATTVLWFSGIALFVSPSLARSDTSKFVLNANTYRMLNDAGFALWFGGTTIAAVTVVATAVLSLRAGVLPKWLAWLSFVVAGTLLVAFMFIPILIFLGWVLVVSVVLAWKRAPEPAGVPVTA